MKKNDVLILFLWLSGVVAAMQFAKISSTIELIQGEIYSTALYSGWLLSSLGIMGMIFGVTSGVIVSRFSPIKLVIVFLVWAAAASFLQALVNNPIAMMIIRVLEGFSQLILVSAAPTALLKVTPKERQSAVMVLWGTFFCMAFLIMNVVQGTLISWGGWRAVFYAHSGLAMVVAFVLILCLTVFSPPKVRETDGSHQEKRSFIAQHKAVYQKGESVFPALLFGCHALMNLVFLTYLPQRFANDYPQQLAMNRFLLIAMPLCSLMGTFLSGVILNRTKKSPFVLIRSALLAMVCFCAILMLAGTPLLFLTVALFILACSGLLQGSIFASIPYLSNDPVIHAYANGAITQMGNMGTTLSAPLFSTLLLHFNWNIAFLLPICSSLLGLALLYLFREKLTLFENAS